MKVRQTQAGDIARVLELYQAAKDFQRQVIGLYQWTDEYPGEDSLSQDMAQGGSFVVEEAGQIVGTFYLQAGPDDTYYPLKTEWKSPDQIVTIHRICADPLVKGIGYQMMEWIIHNYQDVMIDTHKDNQAMLGLIRKFPFQFIGVVQVADGTDRDTFYLDKDHT